MKTKVIAIFSFVLIVSSCYRNNNYSQMSDSNEPDSILCVMADASLEFSDWVDDFQERYPHWTQTKEEQSKLINEFKEKMLSDISFAKDMAKSAYGSVSLSDMSECMARYDKDNGEYGAIWVHLIHQEILLKNPLYNGQTSVTVSYEITSAIPANKEHSNPYVENADYVNTSKSYWNHDDEFYLGSFIVGKKI